MPNAETQGLQGYISELVAATRDGKIAWKAVNPTTFIWESGQPPARISLQRVERMAQVAVPATAVPGRPMQPPRVVQMPQASYIFQAWDMSSPNAAPVLNLDSPYGTELNQPLNELFDLVKSGVSQKTLDFLKSILPK
ncbi:MAG TPA: hypothetical protein VMB47_00555 [Candidatus Aquilonibacter sp.]|nr:hypothetical protein [Candidatus Aquilonibacter sp.]